MNDSTYQPDYGQEFEQSKSNLMLARGVWRVYDWDGARVELVQVVFGEAYWAHVASVPRWFAAKLWMTARRPTVPTRTPTTSAADSPRKGGTPRE